MGRAADAIAASIPRAERAVIEGAGHVVDATLAPVIERFLAAPKPELLFRVRDPGRLDSGRS